MTDISSENNLNHSSIRIECPSDENGSILFDFIHNPNLKRFSYPMNKESNTNGVSILKNDNEVHFVSTNSFERTQQTNSFSNEYNTMTHGYPNPSISCVPKSNLVQYLSILGSFSSHYHHEFKNYSENEKLKHLHTELMHLNLYEDINHYLSREEDLHTLLIQNVGLSIHNRKIFESTNDYKSLTLPLTLRIGNPKIKEIKPFQDIPHNDMPFLPVMRQYKESSVVNNKDRFVIVRNEMNDVKIDENTRLQVDQIILERYPNLHNTLHQPQITSKNENQSTVIRGDNQSQNPESQMNYVCNSKFQQSTQMTEEPEDRSKKRKRRTFKVPRMANTSQEDETQEDEETPMSDFISASEYKPPKRRKDDDVYSTYKAPQWDPTSSLRAVNNDSSPQPIKKKPKKFVNPLEKKEKDEKKKKELEKKKHRPGSDLGLFDENGDLSPQLEGLEEALVERIALEVIESTSTITWEDIGGLEYAKQAVEEAVLWPLQQPEIFSSELLKGSRGLMLFGPPGTGKTLIAKAIASQGAARFFSISASSLMSKWLGEGEQLVKTLFKVAAFLKPSIVFLDEIDAILSKRGSTDDSGGARRLKTEFLVQLDGAGSDSDGIVIICATNLPWEIDDAVLRRIRQKIYVPLPDKNARLQILKSHARKGGVIQFGLSEADFDTVSNITEGYSGSDLKKLSQQAMMIVIRELKRNASDSNQRQITLQDYQAALREIRPSVDTSLLTQFVEWDNKFGSNSE